MWSISELKSKAKLTFKANYWVSVIAAFVITFFTGGGAASSGRSAKDSDSLKDITNIDITIILAVIGAIAIAVLLSSIVKILIGNALIVGAKKTFMLNESSEKPEFRTIISVLTSGQLVNVAVVMFLRDLIIALLSCLLIIPGLIFAYSYKMIPYILAEDPSLKWSEASKKSSEMMQGNKWKAFLLDLSFIGWGILSLFTCGILSFFYVQPYVEQTEAELYLTLKNQG